MVGCFRAGGKKWAMHFPAPTGLKFTAITKGEAWLRLDGQTEARKLRAGAVVLMNTRSEYVLASDLNEPAVEAMDFLPGIDPISPVLIYQGGEDFEQIGAHIHLDLDLVKPLAEIIPECVVVISDAPDVSTMNWLINLLSRERVEKISGVPHRCVTSGAHASCVGIAEASESATISRKTELATSNERSASRPGPALHARIPRTGLEPGRTRLCGGDVTYGFYREI